MAFKNVVHAVLLLAETCFSLAAIIFLSRKLPSHAEQHGTKESSDCTMNDYTGLCLPSSPGTLETAIKLSLRVSETNFALAILSLVIALVRTASLLFAHVPQNTNVLYDVLLFGLWCFSVAQQTVSTEMAGCQQERDVLIEGLHICHVDNACVVVATVGMLMYAMRTLVDAGCFTKRSEADELGDHIRHKYTDKYEVDAELANAHSSSLSPVLAFFPDRVNGTLRSC